MIILLVFLFLASFRAEDCTLTSEAINSGVASDLTTAGRIIGALPSNPYKSVVSIALQAAGLIVGSESTTVMECTTSFSQIINADFQSFYTLTLQDDLEGFDKSLSEFNLAYQNLYETYGDTSSFLEAIFSDDGPYGSYLTGLNSDMFNENPAFFQVNNPQGFNGFQLLTLPYATVFINVHALVLTDLFIWSARKNNDTRIALADYGLPLGNEYCTSTKYITQTYTQSLFNSRTSQISCATTGPECCGGFCCGNSGSCTSYENQYDGVLNIADTWRPDWTASGYPQNQKCFAIEQYTEGCILIGRVEDCSNAGKKIGTTPWPGWLTSCNEAATNERNNQISEINSQLALLNTALENEKSVYMWMLNQAGIICLDICPQNSGCISSGDIVTISSTSFTNLFLRMDSDSCGDSGYANGCGNVNIQYSVDSYSTFILHQNQDKNWCLISNENKNFYLRADGSELLGYYENGGGIVNTQYYPEGSDCSGYEEFNITAYQSGFVIQSVAFPGRYLRMDGTGITSIQANGAGQVNLQYYTGNVPAGYEIFTIASIVSDTSLYVVDGLPEQDSSGTKDTTLIVIIVCVSVGLVVGILIMVGVLFFKRRNSMSGFDNSLKNPLAEI